MHKSTYPIRRWLFITALSFAGLGVCQSAISQTNDLATVTSEPKADNNFAANDLTSSTGDTIVCAFFGLDNALPLRANALAPGAFGRDGMPVNFKDEIDASTLDAEDFLVIDRDGGEHTPIAATLKPADEAGENRTVLLIGEFGTAGSNPPVEVKIVGDLQTKAKHKHASASSTARNLKHASTKNVIPLSEGPNMFFAQIVKGDLAELKENSLHVVQVVQVAWQGGITPVDRRVADQDLFQYYTVFVEEDDQVTPLTPKSIADVNDNDNYHQLLVETHLKIVKVSMPAGIVKDPNGDPNPETQVLVER